MNASIMMAVNSPPAIHRENGGVGLTTTYRSFGDDYSPVQRARLERPLQAEAHAVEIDRPKKDKKWSIGRLFRRKKKDDDSASSSESDDTINSRSNSKRKTKKKKRMPAAVANFDHIVLKRDGRRAQSLVKQKEIEFAEEGVLSDPSAGFTSYRNNNTKNHGTSKESLNLRDDISSVSGKPLDGSTRKSRKGRLKARAEAKRNSMRGDSSSDEESKSSNSSSMVRFRSDDSLIRSRDSSLNKKSRGARNERYNKRLSRDDENQLNKEAELLQQGYTKTEVEMLTRTPTSQSSGYGTCNRDNQSKARNDINTGEYIKYPMKSESISSFPSTQSYPSSINFNAKVNNDRINYCIQYPNQKRNKEPVYENNTYRNVGGQYNTEHVISVKFPLGNLTNLTREVKEPPVPPPRDLHRKVVTPVSMYHENHPVNDDRLHNNNNRNGLQGVVNNDFERVMRRSQERSLNTPANNLRRPLSSSEDHIAIQNNKYLLNSQSQKIEQPRRPASVSAEPNHYGLYINTPPWRNKIERPPAIKPEPVSLTHDFLYYADRSPRSRKPISIQPSKNNYDKQYLSDSQASVNHNEVVYRKPRNASEFWKKLDDVERQKKQKIYPNNRSISDQSNNASYYWKSKLNDFDQKRMSNHFTDKSMHFRNSDFENKNDLTIHTHPSENREVPKMWKATAEYKRSVTLDPKKEDQIPISKTHIRHKSDTQIPTYQVLSDEDRSTERRKSTNLDDALNELEAIYNSLGLGDEDLLDRAERRELMSPKIKENYNDWNGNSDLQLYSQPNTPLRRISRRSILPDKLNDDMAFRRLNGKDKPITKDPQAQISYMLASPVYIPYASDDDRTSDHDKTEPDIIHDDVVYRNIKQTNNRLKTLDPQPPFGIPLGPVTPAPKSDYLHATPENKGRPRFIPRRSPDLVSDDLAYRSLRKDNRNSSLFNGEDFNGHINNNHGYSEFVLTKDSPVNLKKKRAVRSLSANIFTMIQKEIDDALNMSKVTLQKTQSNGDVNKYLRETTEKSGDSHDNFPRNKVKQRHNTVSIFLDNTHPLTNHYVKDDSCIIHDDMYLAKPPSHSKSKSSSPSSRSPQSCKKSHKDEFQQVLTMLAQEAMDTSNKLGVALAELDKNRQNSIRKTDSQSKISDSRMHFLNALTNKNVSEHNIPEVKVVKVHSEIINNGQINEKPNALHNDDSTAKKTEDSLLAISDQLHKVEDKLKHSFEKEINVQDESSNLTEYISKVRDQKKVPGSSVVPSESKLVPDVLTLNVHNDVTVIKDNSNYVNNKKYHEQNCADNNLNSSPIAQSSSKIAELAEINTFNELKDGISDLIAGISQVSDTIFHANQKRDDTKIEHKEVVSGIKEANEKLNSNQQIENVTPYNRGSVNLSIYEDDLEIKRDAPDSTEYNSSEELAAIFKINPPSTSDSKNEVGNIRNDLNSPRLVQTMNQQLRRFSEDNTDNPLSQHNTNIVPWRRNRQNSTNEGDCTEHRKSRSWHEEPGTLVLACSYTLAISQHLASMDWLTLLGLMLAMITIIAMLLL